MIWFELDDSYCLLLVAARANVNTVDGLNMDPLASLAFSTASSAVLAGCVSLLLTAKADKKQNTYSAQQGTISKGRRIGI